MIHVVLWDVGNVLLRWDIRELYRQVFDDPEEMERFLAEVWTPAHNLRCDGGEPFEDVIDEVVAQHPHYESQVRAAHDRWIETIPGPVPTHRATSSAERCRPATIRPSTRWRIEEASRSTRRRASGVAAPNSSRS